METRWPTLLAALVLLPGVAIAQADQSPARVCLTGVYAQHRIAEMGRLQSGPLDMLSIDQLLQRRREQEHYCLQVADCMALEAKGNPERFRATTFHSCLRDETMRQYDTGVQRR